MRPALLALLVAAALSPSLAVAADETPKPKTTKELLDASQPSDWRALDPASPLYLELASARAVVELAPDFAPGHVDNIRDRKSTRMNPSHKCASRLLTHA